MTPSPNDNAVLLSGAMEQNMQASHAGSISTAHPLKHQTELLCDLCLPIRLLPFNLFSYFLLVYFKLGSL